jgi:hypothetical protein
LKRIVLAVLGVATLVACEQVEADHSRLKRIEQDLHAHAANVDLASESVERLDRAWDDVRENFESAALAHQSAQTKFAQAESTYGTATKEFKEAAQVAARAAARWRLYQHLVVIAASLDAANLNASRASSSAVRVNCSDGMSTAAYRALLSASGVAIAGMDVDHIVPRSLGGADHPGNYQLLPSSVNRSLGNTWNEDKCLSVGEARCAKAIATSRACGGLKGLGF